MARVQLVMTDDERERFVHQARQEGMSLSAWLRAAAHERLDKRQSVKRFQSPRTLMSFSGHVPRWKARRLSRTGMNTCES